jgi:hypothetical protein
LEAVGYSSAAGHDGKRVFLVFGLWDGIGDTCQKNQITYCQSGKSQDGAKETCQAEICPLIGLILIGCFHFLYAFGDPRVLVALKLFPEHTYLRFRVKMLVPADICVNRSQRMRIRPPLPKWTSLYGLLVQMAKNSLLLPAQSQSVLRIFQGISDHISL